MKPDSLSSKMVVEIQAGDRWQIYRRLQELDISCQCEAHQPLRVEVEHGLDLIQLWSVIRQFDASRTENIEGLNRCWKRVQGRRDRVSTD
jgi:hypothetical protein